MTEPRQDQPSTRHSTVSGAMSNMSAMSGDENKKLLDEHLAIKEAAILSDKKMESLVVRSVATSCFNNPAKKKIKKLWSEVTAKTVWAMTADVHHKLEKYLVLRDRSNRSGQPIRFDRDEKDIISLLESMDFKYDPTSPIKLFEIKSAVVADDVTKVLIDHLPAIRETLFDSKPIDLVLDRVTAVFPGGRYVPDDKDSLLLSLDTEARESGSRSFSSEAVSNGGRFELLDGQTLTGLGDEEDDEDVRNSLFEYGNNIFAYRAPFEGKSHPVTQGYRIILSYTIVPRVPDPDSKDGEEALRRMFQTVLQNAPQVDWFIITKSSMNTVTDKQSAKIGEMVKSIDRLTSKRQTLGIILKHKYDACGAHGAHELKDVDRALFDQLCAAQAESKNIDAVDIKSMIVHNYKMIHSSAPWKYEMEFIPCDGLDGDSSQLVSTLIVYPNFDRPPADGESSSKRARRGATAPL